MMDKKVSAHFSRAEFACKCGCGFCPVDVDLLAALEDVRLHFGAAVTINSGCRCKRHNRREGGSKNSQHCEGLAADFSVAGVDSDIVWRYLLDKYPVEYGIGRYRGRTHIDVNPGPARRWDKFTAG